ncbi:MAG: hypothetical protein IKQ04_03915 [Oscillospiraceae bacterium]|nr:hypothetical protein [Oscillospiraceae bacterium]
MNANDMIDALNDVNDAYIWNAAHAGRMGKSVPAKKKPRILYRALLAAAIVIALASTVFGIGELIGIWNDRWLQTPASDPIQVVREAISRQNEKDYAVSVNVEQILIDDAETQRIYAWQPNSILAIRDGYGPRPEALEGKQLADVMAIYARYSVVYDHEKSFYRDGTLNQYFYLVRSADGNWEIFDSSDVRSMGPAADPEPGVPEEKDQQTTPARDYSEAILAVTDMVKKWEAFEDVSRITVDEAAFDPEKTAAALQRLNGTTLAIGNGWTEDYLKDHMAAITVTYTIWQDGSPMTETASYWLLQDPTTGEWTNSEITGIMESPDW